MGDRPRRFMPVRCSSFEPGTDLGRLRRDIDALAARHPVAPGGSNYDLSDLGEQFAALQRAMHPDAVALWLFAALVGLASALVVGQALSRQAWEAADDFAVLRSLGFTAPSSSWQPRRRPPSSLSVEG